MWRHRGNSHIWWQTAQTVPCNPQLGRQRKRACEKKWRGCHDETLKKNPKTRTSKIPPQPQWHVHWYHTIFVIPAQSSSFQCTKANMQDHQTCVISAPWWCCRGTMALDGISWEPLKFSFRAAVTNQTGSTVTGGESYANVWVGYCSTGEKVLFQTC